MSRRSYPNLSKAPIVEALVDFRVSSVPDRALSRLSELCSEITDLYPKCENLNQFQAQIQLADIDEVDEITKEQKHIGYRLTSKDEQHIAMMTVDGFTVSRSWPYDRWESLRDEGKMLWEWYRRAVEPGKIIRVALRYINRLELPADLRDFRDYLTAPPDVPPRLPQKLQGFLTRIIIPLNQLGASGIITQQLLGEPGRARVIVLLDIDVFKVVEVPADGKEVWDIADQLRDEKNVIFFESITEKMEDLCR